MGQAAAAPETAPAGRHGAGRSGAGRDGGGRHPSRRGRITPAGLVLRACSTRRIRFPLNGYDALQVMALLRREGLVVQTTPDGRRIVAVEQVEAVPAGSIPSYPPAHRRRWNILLNGDPFPWDTTYIEYGGTLTNLRLLFTYRNMRPIPDIPYVLGP